jgi:hypothetical protein
MWIDTPAILVNTTPGKSVEQLNSLVNLVVSVTKTSSPNFYKHIILSYLRYGYLSELKRFVILVMST